MCDYHPPPPKKRLNCQISYSVTHKYMNLMQITFMYFCNMLFLNGTQQNIFVSYFQYFSAKSHWWNKFYRSNFWAPELSIVFVKFEKFNFYFVFVMAFFWLSDVLKWWARSTYYAFEKKTRWLDDTDHKNKWRITKLGDDWNLSMTNIECDCNCTRNQNVHSEMMGGKMNPKAARRPSSIQWNSGLFH